MDSEKVRVEGARTKRCSTTRDEARRDGRSLRREPLIATVLAQKPRARANVGLTPIVIGVVSAPSHPNAAQTFHAWSPTCLRPEGGLKPGNAERSFLPEVACRRIVWGARPMRLLAEPAA